MLTRSVLRWSALALVFLAGCQQGDEISSRIQKALAERNEVDLGAVIPGQWERVCVLGPYSNNAAAAKALGFSWDVESRSSIKGNDGISLLLFVQGDKVVDYAEHQRRFGDFSNLSGRCFPRNSARFVQTNKDRLGLVPADEAPISNDAR